MTCPECEMAAVNPLSIFYRADCIECEARMLAQGPGAHQRESDHAELLQHEMRMTWPEVDQYKRGRVAVWNWIKRLEGK